MIGTLFGYQTRHASVRILGRLSELVDFANAIDEAARKGQPLDLHLDEQDAPDEEGTVLHRWRIEPVSDEKILAYIEDDALVITGDTERLAKFAHNVEFLARPDKYFSNGEYMHFEWFDSEDSLYKKGSLPLTVRRVWGDDPDLAGV